jgi:hypothetical protein
MNGGQQVGMCSVQWTIHCLDCAILTDVSVSSEPWNMPDGWTPKDYACPENDEHRVELWSESKGCPKCDGSMAVDAAGHIVMWD